VAHLVHLGPPHRVQRLPGPGGVDGVAVGGGDNGGVVGALGPALDFQGIQSGVHQLGHVVDHAHVPGVEDEGPARVLPDGEILAGALLLHQGVLVAAGLGAGAPVGVPPRHVVGQQAAARVADAHGPVDEGLQLQRRGGLGPDLPDLVQGQLPGQDHPAGPQLIPGGRRLVVGDAGLGGDVGLHAGGVLFQQGEHPHVGQDGGVHPCRLEELQPLRQAGRLVVAGHGVAGDVDGHSPAVAQLHGLPELLGGEVAREGAHTEIGARQIDGVGPVGQGHAQALHVPGRGEQFDCFLSHFDTAPVRR